MVSVIIPSWKDPLLVKTINSLLETSELGDKLEIIAVLDGYEPKFELVTDPRVRYLRLNPNRGMRGAINAGVKEARGEIIMRTDEHCMFSQGFDRVMSESCQPNWIMTARRYFLDPVNWKIMDIPPVDYEKLKRRDLGGGAFKFEGREWHTRTNERKDIMVDETMAMQGSCWMMHKKWWEDVIVELDDKNYGTMYQDSHEMQFKTWQAGGKLMLNKNVWFAHKHVSFPRTHQHSRKDWEPGCRYSYETWKDYYETEVRPKWSV
jgi:glycosyltransferase involved in cell wall biosynthesis